MKSPTGIGGKAGIKIADRKLSREACEARSSVRVYIAIVKACGDTIWPAVTPAKWGTRLASLEKLEKVT